VRRRLGSSGASTQPRGETTVQETTDEELLKRSLAQPQLFALFYRRHAEDVLSFLARRTLDPHVAADLTAETFAQAFASRRRFREQGDGSAAGWLFALARHQLSHYIRHLSVESRWRERVGMPRVEITSEDEERIDELIDFERVGRALALNLAALKRDQREALQLRVVEGRSYPEIAGLLSCSEEVARARVSRGLKRLAAHMEQ
jgi:RNA polymerase sigma factor (sigma-70 family)